MADQLQLRRGTTAQNLVFTGAQGEIIVDTDKDTIVVHDGLTPGGFPLANEASVVDGTFYFNDDVAGGSAANAYILSPKVNTSVPTAYLDGVQFGFVTANPNTGPATATFAGLGVRSLKFPGGIDPLAGEVSGRVNLVFDAAAGWFEIQRKSSTAQSQIAVIGASVTANAMTVTMDPRVLDFRSPIIGNGSVNTRSVAAAISLIIPAGATLGTVNGVLSRIVVVAIDNAGTVELAVVNLASGVALDEIGVINTAGITAASNSASTFYSNTARAGVPYRVLGFVQSTQAVAGTWSTVPGLIQGQGGQNIIGLSSKLNMAVAQNTTAGTSIDFTNIPSWVKKITVAFNGVSTSGASVPIIQMGTTSGVETSGYSGYTVGMASGGNALAAWATGAYMNNGSSAAVLYAGSMRLTLVGSNSWAIDLTIGQQDSARVMVGGGSKSLAAILDRVRLTTVNGTDTFDAGSVNIIYEG